MGVGEILVDKVKRKMNRKDSLQKNKEKSSYDEPFKKISYKTSKNKKKDHTNNDTD